MCFPRTTPSNGDGGDGGTMANRKGLMAHVAQVIGEQLDRLEAQRSVANGSSKRLAPFDRPDVENPDIGPFIAYFDARYWLAKRIFLQEWLPINEADTRAEKTIRYICMNTPEKLTMWGFHKADPDAGLKPVTPQAWQGLSINPLAGQPEADLKAVGYRREYGAATKGEYGPVIWMGLCFDRKQFVAAFVTGGGNGPPAYTPAARPTQLGERTPRKQPLRERAQRALVELYPNGVPDQISKSNAELVSTVNAQIKKTGQQGVSRDTILRAAGRCK